MAAIERSYRVDEFDYEELKRIADIEGTSVSNLVRLALKCYINAYNRDFGNERLTVPPSIYNNGYAGGSGIGLRENVDGRDG